LLIKKTFYSFHFTHVTKQPIKMFKKTEAHFSKTLTQYMYSKLFKAYKIFLK